MGMPDAWSLSDAMAGRELNLGQPQGWIVLWHPAHDTGEIQQYLENLSLSQFSSADTVTRIR